MFFKWVFIVEKSKFVTMKKANENVRKNLELELQELMNATPTFRDTKAERAIANADHIVETCNKIDWSKSSF
ncbi:MAG: hypothetical protein RLY35_608 [Bacteroidota bacterium]|jgi:hypothetical protein